MSIPTFKDRATTEAMGRAGYVVVPGFAEKFLPRLFAVYEDMLAALPASDPYFESPMTGTNWIGSPALRMRILAEVGQIVGPELGSILEDHRLVGAGFRVKQAGPESHLPLHQDPTTCDEDRHWAMQFIVPLVDTSPDNGALKVVPGSHRIMPKLRSLDLEDRAETYGLHDVIDPLVETVPMRAGDVIFYFQSLLHGSGPNVTADVRPVVLGGLMAHEARMTVYFRKPEQPRVFEPYEVPDDYFNRMEDFEREHKLRPTVGRRLEDVVDSYDLSRDDIIAAFRSLLRNPAESSVPRGR
jgi:ectoine hydroxylase-related dioxygenase (phytanoyl-CoA dioxygenase family)